MPTNSALILLKQSHSQRLLGPRLSARDQELRRALLRSLVKWVRPRPRKPSKLQMKRGHAWQVSAAESLGIIYIDLIEQNPSHLPFLKSRLTLTSTNQST